MIKANRNIVHVHSAPWIRSVQNELTLATPGQIGLVRYQQNDFLRGLKWLTCLLGGYLWACGFIYEAYMLGIGRARVITTHSCSFLA